MGPLGTSISRRVHDLFLDAIEVQGSDRERLLSRASGDLPPDARNQLLDLLAAHDSAGAFLAEPTVSADSAADTGPSSLRGAGVPSAAQRIGPYTLLSELGEGGFGTVYLADQTTPVRRRVALKLIKRGMDTRQVIQRFNTERQALALMNHPNIARVFDAGQTDAGAPWFAMELVEGVPITLHVEKAALSIRQRVELFLGVCRGVAHAHQRGVIHRDIKPANILVATIDGKPVPKIIDFGIARALNAGVFDQTLTSESMRGIGTPQYMSPEQAGGAGAVDVRTDVYALGVVLYELLTGVTPIDSAVWKAVDLVERLRIVREQELPRPSRRLETADIADRPAAARRREARALRGDLDWLVGKATAKEPDRRYGSADALAADLENYLAYRPIAAGPPSPMYVVRKFLRRHRVGAAAATVATVGMAVGGALAASGYLEARDERLERVRQQDVAALNMRLADERARQAAAAEDRAREQSTIVQSARESYLDLMIPLAAETPEQRQAAIQRLDEFADRIDRAVVDVPPALRAAMESSLAYSYHIYKCEDKAVERGRHAVRLLKGLGPAMNGDRAVATTTLAASIGAGGATAEVVNLFAEVVEIYRSSDDPAFSEKVPGAMVNLAVAQLNSGNLPLARQTFDAALAEAETRKVPRGQPRRWCDIFVRRLERFDHAELAAEYRARRDALPEELPD